ncbi:cupin [Rhizobium lusitanum]|uniref:Cupin n=1 Tax=Rhizobium lusitanum TaxID=293958 RepID=A0A6L9UEG9_9HYPH|nr:cupin domain-containing protein [Rhizobium lusitanum]NEI72526.1 cupin [Rhizobium lusitanum]
MNAERVVFQPSDWVPNNQKLPVLIYRAALGASPDFESAFAGNDWADIWRDGVFDYQHYHSGAHEVLGVGRGRATLLIGGPAGRSLEVSKGDCLILPAGTGHRNLGSSPDFQVFGAYPKGQHADIQTAAATTEMLERISSLPVPDTDPLFGSMGDLLRAWR